MKREAFAHFAPNFKLLVVVIWLGSFPTWAAGEDNKPFGLDRRIPWTTSRVVGTPDPPLPYTTERAFREIAWDRPIYAKTEPSTDFLVVVEQAGQQSESSRLTRLGDQDTTRKKEPLLEVPGRVVYGIEFHPDYQRNGYLYVFSNGPTGESERKNRISRYTIVRDGKQNCDVDSELIILEWRSMGHDGGDLAFGNDGMLYISSGDGTSDSDGWLSGQDISNLLGGVLRIDVGRLTPDRPYSIPKDNPFVNIENARGELWAFGLRNPWRLSADHISGQIWVGNNGQDLWETAHLVRRGENGIRAWRFPARAECMSCHSRAVNFVLGMTELQMNRSHDYPVATDNQLRTLAHIGLFDGPLPKPIDEMPRLVDPYDESAELRARARSYLHVNCSSCHVEAGGGNARMELEWDRDLGTMNLLAARPQHDTFGIPNAMLVAPGDADRSVLLTRLSRRGRGQMPPLVSKVVDQQAVELIRHWIVAMERPKESIVRQWKVAELGPALDQLEANRSYDSGQKVGSTRRMRK
jgi:hypothetical protein